MVVSDTDAATKLAVAEIFTNTIQGEGPSAGMPATFLRLSGCNLACAWCDTPYTWDWTGKNGKIYDIANEVSMMSQNDVRRALEACSTPLLVITGGEPILQDKALYGLLRDSLGMFQRTEIETNGTKIPCFPSDWVSQYNVSPKLSTSGNGPERENPEAIAWYRNSGRAIFKFVVTESWRRDFEEIDQFVMRHRIPEDRVWIMPEGRTAIEIADALPTLVSPVVQRGYKLTSRLHILLWGDVRGR
jgi:organic radical activating enzyme